MCGAGISVVAPLCIAPESVGIGLRTGILRYTGQARVPAVAQVRCWARHAEQLCPPARRPRAGCYLGADPTWSRLRAVDDARADSILAPGGQLMRAGAGVSCGSHGTHLTPSPLKAPERVAGDTSDK
jgi:hypothetical protein